MFRNQLNATTTPAFHSTEKSWWESDGKQQQNTIWSRAPSAPLLLQWYNNVWLIKKKSAYIEEPTPNISTAAMDENRVSKNSEKIYL